MRLPDRFDLCVRKIKDTIDPERQLDLLLGSLFAKRELYLWNIGTKSQPQPATSDLDGEAVLILFSDSGRLLEALETFAPAQARDLVESTGLLPVLSPRAFDYCIELKTGLLVNPLSGEFNFCVAHNDVKSFYEAWAKHAKSNGTGFWIPSMTNEEEDFWQENGL